MERSKEMVVSKKGILFLCTGNSCRSQMAEGFAKKILPKDLKIFSAGIEPKRIHPKAVKVMKEAGIDISQQRPKNISEVPIDKIDLVVTLCGDAAENCPVFPGTIKKIHWAVDDPAKAQGSEEEITRVFLKIRDNIKSYIISYLLVE
jgi:arsenate reductase